MLMCFVRMYEVMDNVSIILIRMMINQQQILVTDVSHETFRIVPIPKSHGDGAVLELMDEQM